MDLSVPAEWNSNEGLTSGSENAVLPMEITIVPGASFQWGIHLIVGATAENYPCRVGAGTCGLEGGALANANFKDTALFQDFRLFEVESGEEITDFTLTGSGGVDYLAIDRGCGNDTLDDGEDCDDGNLVSGDCCSVSCKLEQGDCDDADACTADGVCDDGVCAGAAPISCPLPCGDADDNGKVTAVDALAALRTAVGSSQCEACRCDANDENAVTTSDALKILQAAVGQPVLLDCPAC